MKEEERLSLALNSALVQCPVLLDELPQMLHAIDGGEAVAVDRISDSAKRDAITDIFRQIPLLRKHPEFGWHLVQKGISARSFLLGTMLDAGKIIEPRDLNQAQQQSTRTVTMTLVRLLQRYPNLKEELPDVLDKIIDGEKVRLDGLGDEECIEDLEKLFRGLGLVVKRGEVSIPDEDYSTVKRAVKFLCQVFDDYEDHHYYLKKMAKAEKKSSKKQTKKRDRHNNDDSSSSSDSSSDVDASSSDESDRKVSRERSKQAHTVSTVSYSEDMPPAKVSDLSVDGEADTALSLSTSVRQQGPARPSAEALAMAAQLTANYSDEEDDGDDDDFGPRLAPRTSVSSTFPSSAPLGFVGVDPSTLNDDPAPTSVLGKKRERDEEEDSAPNETGGLKREAWILEPGESRALNALGGGGDSAIDPLAMFGKSRKFQTGKQAKKNAEAVIIQREYARSLIQKEAEEASKRAKTLDGADEMHREVYENEEEEEEAMASQQRPLSLMEEHLAKRQRQAEEKRGKPVERRPFDRETDVLSRRKVGDAEMYQLVKNAKELTGRFDQPIVQKTFL